jgi:RNA polymerase sigma-70 factor (ECF subfamily)
VDGIVALLMDDAWLTMPPLPFEFQGHDRARRFFTAVVAFQGPRPRLVATRANGQPAFGLYVRDPRTRIFHAIGVLVLTLAGSKISAITQFDNSVLPSFGLPRTLPE